MKEYADAIRKRDAPADGTLNALIHDYETSKDFERLGDTTKRDHRAMFKRISEEFGDMPIEALEDRECRRDFKQWRDSIVSDRQADRAWASLKRVFSVAVDNGVLSWNPCAMGGKRYTDDRSDCIWSEAQFATFTDGAPAHVSLPLFIAYHTGQRQGDILRLQWSAYDGQRIRLTQRKTGRQVSVLASVDLRRVLDSLKKGSTYVCTNSRGKPWTSSGYSASFRKWQKRLLIAGVTFHDMRGTFITHRTKEGSTLLDIAKIAGLSTKDVSKVLEKHYLAHDDSQGDAVILRMDGRR